VTIELLAFLAGAGLILDTSTARVVTAYAVIVGLVAFVVAPATLNAPLPLVFFTAAFALKLVAAPIAIWAFLNRSAAARSLRPALDLPLRLIVVLALAGASQLVPRVPGLGSIPHAGMAAYIVLCGLAMLVLHRNLLAHVIGLLVLSSGVTLAGIICAPQLPEAVELGAAFDVLVVTFIGLALVRTMMTENPLLDIESLRRLRG
jgi:hydrogenase-4 membrane subunit HyfE